MPQVIKIGDQANLVKTSEYPYGSWDFDTFNPVQSRLLEIYDGDSNVAVAAATSAGKTVCSELYLAHEIRKKGGKGIYIGPLKALCKEKEQDWTASKHHFHDLKMAIVTGDYRMTTSRIKELEQAQLILMTPEMLASRARNHKSEKSSFLKDVGVIVYDESHLLTVPGRGDHIEVALMKLTEINPDARLVMLSATMPNVDEVCGWVSKLTGRDTYCLESEYRPCPLSIHYETYFDGDRSYQDRELQKVATACAIVEYYPDDKFLIFVHTIDTGRHMVKALERYGVKAEYHYSHLDHKTRLDLETRFKNDKSLRVLVATSGLAWGIDSPARRVIVTGVHRGLTEVENYDIQQMVGRAGRPRYDPRGDAYILLPDSQKNEWVARLTKKSPIRSTLLDFVGKAENPHYKTLAFHIVSEIDQGGVTTKDGFHDWFCRSLAHHQDHSFDDGVIDRTIGLLEQYRAVAQENGGYRCTAVGKIASMFYYSPFDVGDLRRNFSGLFDLKKDNDDAMVALALGDVDSHRWSIANRAEKEEMASFASKVRAALGEGRFTDGTLKIAYAHLNMLKGRTGSLASEAVRTALLADLDRTFQVIAAIDAMAGNWGRRDWLDVLKMRLRYGVGPELVQLCQITHVGQVRAKRLKAAGIHTPDDLVALSPASLAKLMKCGAKLAQEAWDSAQALILKAAL